MNDMYRPPFLTEFRPDDLLSRYQRGMHLFASPRHAILAYPGGNVLPPAAHDTLCQEAMAFQRAARSAGNAGLLLGAIPFHPNASAQLFTPTRFERVTGVLRGVSSPIDFNNNDTAHGTHETQFRPTPDKYQDHVSEAIARIREGALEKVVLSRALSIRTRVDIPSLMRRLLQRNMRGYTYAVDLHGDGVGRQTLVGASPELLVARRGRQVISNPLAGSIPRCADPQEDAKRAQGLLHSHKDKHEHALVVRSVAAALRPFCSHLVVPKEPSLISTETMWHLSTEVKGDLRDSNTSSLELALALHPTPAVCGYPTSQARAFIDEVEGFDRGFFTGLVGWCDANGDGEWAVTIRCAVIDDASATLYAGAGVVAGSDPALELAETSAKLRTMLRAMGLESALEALP